MSNRTIALAVLGCLTLVSGAVAAGARAADDKTYTLAPKYTVGEVIKYKMKTNMNMEMTAENGQSPFPGGDMSMNMAMKYRTTKLDPDGIATVVMTTSGGEMSFMGQNMQMPEMPAITMQVDKRGISKTVTGVEKIQGMEAMSQMFNFNSMPSSGFYYPDHPVKVGDTWDAELPPALGSGKQKMKVTSQFLGVDTVDGKEVYKVKQTWTIPLQVMVGQGGVTTNPEEAFMVMTGSFVSAGDVVLAADSGRITKLVSDVKGGMTMEMKGPAAQQSPFGSKMNMKMAGKAEMGLTGVGKASDEPEAKEASGANPTTSKKPANGKKPAKP